MTPTSTKSDFNVEVVTVSGIQKHPNADRLSIVHVLGYPVVIQSTQFKEGDLAVYIPVDALVPLSNPAFEFLKKPEDKRSHHRVQAVRLRKVYSEGLLIPAPEGVKVGDNVQELLGISKFMTQADKAELFRSRPGAKTSNTNPDFMPVYGLDSLRRFPELIPSGTQVVITEKIHGCNARYCYRDGRLYVGSHKVMRGVTRHRILESLSKFWLEFKAAVFGSQAGIVERTLGDVWWEIAEKYELKDRLAKSPNLVFYGEIYGEGLQTRGGVKFVYDSPAGHKFRVFDIYDPETRSFLSYNEMVRTCLELDLDMAPHYGMVSWNLDEDKKCADGMTWLGPGTHIREGFVVRTDVWYRDRNRTVLKFVSEDYKLLGD